MNYERNSPLGVYTYAVGFVSSVLLTKSSARSGWRFWSRLYSPHNTFEINYTNGAKIKSKAVKKLALTDKIGAKVFRSPFVVI